MDFSLSELAQTLSQKIRAFLDQHVLPQEALYFQQLGADGPHWREWKVPPIMETWKAAAREQGLWNLFLPPHGGAGLSNCDYAPLAEIMGHSPIAPEIFNCNAPDTGNMEVLYKYGSEEQKERWLKPLLDGRIRSVFFMTEPDVASSDATNMQATCRVEGSEIVLNGRKWWSSGVGHPDCKVGIFMGVSDPNAPRHQRHSMVLVPLDAPGVKIERMLPVFHSYDAPYGHGEVSFHNVRLPVSALIAGAGRGFEIAQGRLGPGRIHHCMRAIGAAERALKLLCQRASQRVAFGKPLYELGGNRDIIAEARMRIDMARLLTLKAAWMIDKVGVHNAMSEISQIKVVAPNVAQDVIDQAIQIHGGAGLSDDFPLAALYAYARVLRIADGPDEVHRNLIAKLEWKRQGLG
jgi:alkylation response protein AidB-like acyl-CoA dehydrogenase